jgi:hypothetical protein
LSYDREQLLSSLGAIKLLVGLKTAAQLHPALGGGEAGRAPRGRACAA